MPVFVTVYYRDTGDREADLKETLARLGRRISMLEPGAKLDAAKDRVEKVELRIRELGESEVDEKMRAKFRKDMADLAESCRAAVGPASFRYDDDDEDAIIWDFSGAPEKDKISELMQSVGMHETQSGEDSTRFEFSGELTAELCNRIRLAVEAAARILWEAHGQETENRDERSVYADEPEIPRRAWEGVRQGAAEVAARILACEVVGARAGRGWLPRRAGGLHLGSDGRWLEPEAELILWIRELMKWINREGRSSRDEIEEQIGAMVANDPTRDRVLFEQAIGAVVGAEAAAFDGTTVSTTVKKEDEDAS